MAVRADATGEYLSRTSGVPTKTAFTACGWATMRVDRNNYSTIFTTSASGSVNGIVLQTEVDGTALVLYWYDSWFQGGVTIATLAADTPFFWAVTGGASSIRAIHITQAGTLSSYTSSSQTSATLAEIHLLTIPSAGEWFNGSVDNVLIYDRVLSDAELRQQMWSRLPVSFDSLHAWWPLLNHTDVADYSGNGRNLTATGSISTEDGAPVPWGKIPSRIWIPAAGGGTDVTVSAGVLSGTFNTNAITFVLDHVLSIAAQSAQFSIPAISLSTEQVLVQTAKTTTFAINSPIVSIDVSTTAGVNLGTFNTNTISYIIDQVLSIGAQEATFSIPLVTVISGGDVVVQQTTPGTLVALLNTPGVVTDAILDIETNTLTFVLNPATVQISTPTTGVVSRMYIVLGLR